MEREAAELAQRYGAPLRQTATLLDSRLFDPLSRPDRVGEVCMVIRRRNGKLLTARKTFYPANAYRLLTGGIKHDESILGALLRETEEETGLEVEVRRFLAVIDYALQRPGEIGAAAQQRAARFHTFAFLLDEISGLLACYDPDERVEDFREVAVDELPALAAQLEQLGQDFDPEIDGRWRDWGRFRAVVHRTVYQTLSADDDR
jgi:8-oxo-dGTP pyrophosphatase MutT (NUDIX family)